MTNVIVTEKLSRIYRENSAQPVHALAEVDLAISAGSFVVLKGRSGSGKTTLLNCLGGLDRPTSGVIRILGRDLNDLSDKELTQWRLVELGFIFQSFGLLPTLSAFENVELILRMANVKRNERRERSMHVLEMVGLEKQAKHRPYELSGGQQQRLAIARAISNSPKLILADEPTGELDTETTELILSLFRRVIEEDDSTLLMTSHDELVTEYADQVLTLENGKITELQIIENSPV